MIKGIIATDLDGTLLDKEGSYSLFTRDYLRALQEKGYLLVITSGRPFRAMKHIYDDLRCKSYLIAYNGLLTYNPSDLSSPRRDKRIPMGVIKSIVEASKGIVDSYMAETLDTIYVDNEDSYLYKYFPRTDMKIVSGHLPAILNEDAYTCLFSHDRRHNDAMARICAPYKDVEFRPWRASDHSELFVAGYDKGAALSWILEQCGLTGDDLIAFGDADNDRSMLRIAKRAFAMSNSPSPELLSSFEVTKYPVDEDGVVRQLMELGL